MNSPILFAILIGFIAGFFFSVWVLNRLYKQTYKKYTETMDEQYLYLLKQQGFKIKEDAGL